MSAYNRSSVLSDLTGDPAFAPMLSFFHEADLSTQRRAQIVLFATGQGNPYGSALAPTVKISANPDTLGRVVAQIDIDANAVLDGTAPRMSLVPSACHKVLEIACGALTWSKVVGEKTESISRLASSN